MFLTCTTCLDQFLREWQYRTSCVYGRPAFPACLRQLAAFTYAVPGRADVQKQDYFNVSPTFDNLPRQVWEHQWAYLGNAKGPAVVLG